MRDPRSPRPMFRADLQAAALDANHLVLLGENGHQILHGAIYLALAPMLDGRHTAAQMVEQIGATFSSPEVYYALGEAQRASVVVDGCPTAGLDDAVRAFRHAGGAAGTSARPLAVIAAAGADRAPLLRALEANGIGCVDVDAADIVAVVVDDYLAPGLAALNAQFRAAEKTWLPLRLVGSTAWFGPLFGAAPGCWECLAVRQREHRQAQLFLEGRLQTPVRAPDASTGPGITAAAAIAATELTRLVYGGAASPLAGHVLTFDLLSMKTSRHRLLARPQCPVCGDPVAPLAAPPQLTPSPKRFTTDGGHRVCHPDETLARYGHLVSPVTGVIGSIHDRSDDASGVMHSLVAVHHFPLVREDLGVLRDNLAGRSGGKGASRVQATASALGEAVERYSGVWRGNGEESTIVASRRQLGEAAIDLAALLCFSDVQLAERAEWNPRLTNPHHLVPNPLDADMPIAWSAAWSLRSGQRRYVPAAYCWYGHPDLRHFLCFADTNGCASGNTLTEAILQAFFELAERDAVAIWWYNKLRRPQVDLASFKLPWLARQVAIYAAAGRDVQVLDLSHDLGIPTFAAVSRRHGHGPEDIILGFGAHFDAQLALSRALTELNQSLPIVSARDGAGDTLYNTRSDEALQWLRHATYDSEPYLVADPTLPVRSAGTPQPSFNADVADDVRRCVDIAAARGLDVIVIDQTRADVGMPAARVIVPGLRHFWRRLGPGRLYDVPVQCGWLAQPRSERQLNSYSIFF